MAEFVQREIEDMLQELECLKKSNILTIEETRFEDKINSFRKTIKQQSVFKFRSIMKQRKKHEYKMQRRTKEKEVYLQYIQYEINVLELIKQRRQVCAKNNFLF